MGTIDRIITKNNIKKIGQINSKADPHQVLLQLIAFLVIRALK